jgi:hypothetical protein
MVEVRSPIRSFILLLAVSVVVSLLVAVSSASPAAAAISQDEFEACLLEKINEDRQDAGAVPLEMA